MTIVAAITKKRESFPRLPDSSMDMMHVMRLSDDSIRMLMEEEGMEGSDPLRFHCSIRTRMFPI